MLIDQQQYCLITFSDINGIYPVGYQEKVYFKGRPVKVESHKEEFLTEDKMRTVFDPHYQNRIVQALIYDKYELKLIIKENYDIEVLKYAEQILIFSYKQKKQFIPVIEEINVNEIAGTHFKEVVITFWDKFIDNYYKGYPVINHLRSDSLSARGYTGTQLTKISLVPLNHDTWTTQYDFYSPFYMNKSTKTDNKTENELNGRNYNTRVTSKGYRDILFYLNENDAYNLGYYAPLCNLYNGRVDITEPGAAKPVNYEMPEIEIEKVKGAVDLYKCTLKITTAILNNLTYST